MALHPFFEEVRALRLPRDQYAIFGSGPLAIRHLREAHDVDLIVSAELWDDLARIHPVYDTCIRMGNIQLFRDWKPWFDSTEELIATADVIEGLPFVRLDFVLAWKKAYGRKKDVEDVLMIEEYLQHR